VQHEEEQTGERILGDENTGNMERLAERARNRQRKGCSEQYLALRCRVGTVVTHAIVRYTIIALIVIDLLIFMLEVHVPACVRPACSSVTVPLHFAD